MGDTLVRLEAFIAKWSQRLNADSASVTFAAQALDAPPGLHAATADRFVTALGYQPIGGNWELLDPDAAPDGARSARAALIEAFSHNMVLSQQAWLGEADALAMAEGFLGCFDARTCQIVTNRMYFGWNPITSASIEWAFVAFDDSAIALLLATAEG
ncbi:MAG: hypothetical protein GW858_09835 [Sphingomonadales bacterium]|nr:hypothetical protein [Sphingomonadales bacterium]NCT04131.1 hypothetical protein [Sphingomonadales bacterium]